MLGRGASVCSLFRRRNSTTTTTKDSRRKGSLNTLPSASTVSLEDDDDYAAGADASCHWLCSLEDGNNTRQEAQEEVEERRSELLEGEHTEEAATADTYIMQQQQRLTDLDERLRQWQEILENDDDDNALTPMERANLFFATGRLLVHLGRYEEALKYYEQELQMTMAMLKKTTTTTTTANTTHSVVDAAPGVILVARIHLAIGRVANNGLHDASLALQHYEKALQIQTVMYQAAVKLSSKCSRCCNEEAAQQQRQQQQQQQRGSSTSRQRGSSRCARVGVSGGSSSSTSSSLCNKDNNNNNISCCTMQHRDKVKEAAAAVEDTRRRIGRIHFELGNVDLAVLQLSVQQYPCTTSSNTTIQLLSLSGVRTKQQQQQVAGTVSRKTKSSSSTTSIRPCSTTCPTKKDLSSNDEHLVEI